MSPRVSRSGLLLSLWAVIALLAAGAAPPDLAAAAVTEVPICHANADNAPSRGPAHRNLDCAICPLCVTMLTAAATLPTPAIVPRPSIDIRPVAGLPPPATAPPSPLRLAAHPRGPPAFLA